MLSMGYDGDMDFVALGGREKKDTGYIHTYIHTYENMFRCARSSAEQSSGEQCSRGGGECMIKRDFTIIV